MATFGEVFDHLKNGGRIRRTCYLPGIYLILTKPGELLVDHDGNLYESLSATVGENDWEIVENPIQITKQKFLDAYAEGVTSLAETNMHTLHGGYSYGETTHILNTMMRKLGL